MSSISSLSSSQYAYSTQSLFSKMDTDGSGSVSKEEFTSARPSDVSETMAENLFDQLDSSGTGSLSESDIDQMESNKKDKSSSSSTLDDSTLSALQALLQNIGSSGTTSTAATSDTGDSGLSDMISAMDTNGDGTITQDEFVSARPDGVSEDQATAFWNELDTDGTGSLSTSDLKTAMADNAPPPPPPGGMQQASSSSDSSSDPLQTLLDELTSSSSTDDSSSSTADSSSTSSTSTTTSSNSALLAFLDAIKSYDSVAGYDATKTVMSSLLMAA